MTDVTQALLAQSLINSQVLEARRRKRNQAILDRLPQETGLEFGLRTSGFAVGQGLKALADKTGLVRDEPKRRAREVSQAQARAQTNVRAIPRELRETRPFRAAIQERQELIAELEAGGLQPEADQVRLEVMGMMEQERKFAKLNNEVALQDQQLIEERFENERRLQGLREGTEIQNLINELQTLDVTDPVQAAKADFLAARINKLVTVTGTTEFDVPFDEVTVRRVDSSLQATVGALDGFLAAQNDFDPRFLQLAGKTKNFAVRLADIAGLPLDEATKQELRDFTRFKQITSTNLNAYIKAITGAQMSNPEAIRLRQDVPTFDDSPTAYLEKLNATIERLGATRDRALKALSAADDQDEFRRILATPLEEFVVQGGGDPDSVTARTEAQDALQRLEAILDGGAN